MTGPRGDDLVARISQSPNSDPRDRLLDAAERVLARDGRHGFTTRRIAHEAGVNHGLVHYHFGSLETLTVAVAHRHFRRVLARRRATLERPAPFIERWRDTVRAFADEQASGDARVAAELRAIGFEQAEVRVEVAAFITAWRDALTVAFDSAAREYGLTPAAVAPLVTLVATFTSGMADERLLGVDRGHAALLEWVDGMIDSVATGTAG